MPATILKEKDGEPIFRTHPNKQEAKAIIGILISAIYSFILIPFKGYLFTHTWTNIILVGSSISQLFSGAEFYKGRHLLIFGIIVGTLSALKFLPFYWGAGKYLGGYYIDAVIKNSPMLKKIVRRFEGFIRTHAFLSILIVNIPFFPISNAILAIIIGDSGVTLKKYLSYTSLVIVARSSLWFTLGYIYGKPVLDVIQIIEKYIFYVTLALIALIAFRTFKEYRRGKIH